MAEGAWVPAFDSLWDSPKTQRLARRVEGLTKVRGLLAVEVAGSKFLKLMAWMRDNASSGDLGPVDRASIALVVGLAASKDRHELAAQRGQAFYDWLVEAEFISSDGRGHVKGWEEGPGKLVLKREADRLRKEHERTSGAAHPSPVDNCSHCRAMSGGNVRRTSTKAPAAAPASTGLLKPIPSLSTRTERTDTTDRTGNPPPPALSRGPDGRTPGEAARDVLESATGRWREALQQLLLLGVSNTNLATWFRGTVLEPREDVVIVRVPNAFSREWLEGHYRREVARVLEVETDRVVFALEGQVVQERTLQADEAEPEIPDAPERVQERSA